MVSDDGGAVRAVVGGEEGGNAGAGLGMLWHVGVHSYWMGQEYTKFLQVIDKVMVEASPPMSRAEAELKHVTEELEEPEV